MTMQARAGTSPDAGFAPVLDVLHTRQEARGYLAEEDISAAAELAGLSAAELYSAVTAYPRFRFVPDEAIPAVCTGLPCLFRGSAALLSASSGARETHCLGLCDQPVALLTADGPRVSARGTIADLQIPATPAATTGVAESAFFAPADPFDAVRTARDRQPDEVISLVTESTLEGRGGGGFPTGRKWNAVRAAPSERKFVVCNADESEPGTFKDRLILDHQPRRLLAGMALAAYAIGASVGVVYIRFEYRPQEERLLEEIGRLRGEGLLGNSFDVVVRRGAGCYVCGEETALLNSLEGQRPIPRDRPPYPVTSGLFGAPTLVQNVETLAALPAIVNRGPQWYRDAGSPKLYCVSGDVPNPGVFELPLGVTARELIERAGVSGTAVKAFTLGGLSGGLLPASALDVRLDFTDPRRYGAFLGSGAIIVAGHDRCTVRLALEAMRFLAGESCGKCFPCRIGTTRLRERLDDAVAFRATDSTEVDDIIDVLTSGSACGLGPAAALIVRHLVEHFGEELSAHQGGRCPAGECAKG